MKDFKDDILEEQIGRERYCMENTHGKNREDAIKEYRRLRRLRGVNQ